ncbi:MAG: hypothetical protein JRF33_18465 [Deltaproteobacteria bacterium]|nr:hypothetical protein [Deltaproteobacteria bacterium]
MGAVMGEGTLKGFRAYLKDQLVVLDGAEKRLGLVQEKYETFFQEMLRVREQEFGQLEAHLVKDRSVLPADFLKAVDKHWRDERAVFLSKVGDLKKRHESLMEEAEAERQLSIETEQGVRQRNKSLDDDEEELKARSVDLLKRVEVHNARIRELGSGFGFWANYFKMRKLHKENKQLKQEQREVAATIEKLRKIWIEEDETFAGKEKVRKHHWHEKVAEAATVQTKIEYLMSVQSRIIQRGALEKLLFERRPKLSEAGKDDPKCPRCSQPNPADRHFCHICASRLRKDRPDFEGSLLEMAELNHHHDRFDEGMKACQEVIGLIRGVKSGFEAFLASVNDMIHSQQKYSLGKLEVYVPESCKTFDDHFVKVKELAGEEGEPHVHPVDYSGRIKPFMDEFFTEETVKVYFEALGAELNAKAEAQWK